uniref:Uncharacterized protein n=1 Tax=Caenorhabditis japonica TaxID=281687 RepID=A0A8R1DN27_CAEJA
MASLIERMDSLAVNFMDQLYPLQIHFSESEENVKDVQKLQLQIYEFRSSVTKLLDKHIVEGLIRKLVQKSISSETDSDDVTTPVMATDVKCVKDGFTKHNTLQFKVIISEQVEMKANRCIDLGDSKVENKIYLFPEEYLLERNGKFFALDGKKCLESFEDVTVITATEIDYVHITNSGSQDIFVL